MSCAPLDDATVCDGTDAACKSLSNLPLPLLEDIAARVLHMDGRAFGQLRCTSVVFRRACTAAVQRAHRMDVEGVLATTPMPQRAAALVSLVRAGQPLLSLDALVLDSSFAWLNDACLDAISSACPALRSVSVRHCSSITPAGVEHLAGLARLQVEACGMHMACALLHVCMLHAAAHSCTCARDSLLLREIRVSE